MMSVRSAGPGDAQSLSAIADAAKRHWGYPEDWLALWKSDLTVSTRQIDKDHVLLCVLDDHIAGFVAISANPAVAEIEHLWVLPEFMGRGVGRTLLQHALAWCRGNAITRLKVVSDPNALGFYQAMGGKLVGSQPSRPAPRELPIVEFVTSTDESASDTDADAGR